MSAMPEAEPDAFDQAFDRAIKTVLESDTVPPDNMEMTDAGIDSFRLVSMMMALEDELDSMWPLEYLVDPLRITTIGFLRSLTRDVLYETSR